MPHGPSPPSIPQSRDEQRVVPARLAMYAVPSPMTALIIPYHPNALATATAAATTATTSLHTIVKRCKHLSIPIRLRLPPRRFAAER